MATGSQNLTTYVSNTLAPRINNISLSNFIDGSKLIYTYYGGGNSISDKPTSVDAFGVMSFKTADSWYGQLLMSSDAATGVYWRTATSLSGGWRKLLDSSNYTDYTVTKTGDGASGTWDINITGNAATATKATQDGSGNVITSKYVTVDTAQTITGGKSFGTNGAGCYINGAGTNGGLNSILIGDDVWLGDCNASGIMGMKSTGSNCGFYFYNSGGTQIGQFYCRNTTDIYTNRYFYMPGSVIGTSWVGSRDRMGLRIVADDSTSSTAHTVCGIRYPSYSFGLCGERAGNTFGIVGWTNRRTANGYDGYFYIKNDMYFRCSTRIYNAVWNDFAEYRQGETTEGGRAVYDDNSGIMKITTERLQPAARLISDTYGVAVGESDIAHTPIGVGGRVLAYPYQDRNNYKVGDAVCAAPNGTVDIMTREEIREYPDRIIGIVSEIPKYKVWENRLDKGDRGKAIVDIKGRIWIYVR